MKKEIKKITVDEFWKNNNNAIHCKNKSQFAIVVKVFSKMDKHWVHGLKYRESDSEDYSRFIFTTFGSDGTCGLKRQYRKSNIYEFDEVDFSKYLENTSELTL